jgi:ATP synthase protein I
MVIELATGIMLGSGIGYGLDVLFGTLPIFLVIFSLVGFAAGIRTMLGTARELAQKTAAAAATDKGA